MMTFSLSLHGFIMTLWRRSRPLCSDDISSLHLSLFVTTPSVSSQIKFPFLFSCTPCFSVSPGYTSFPAQDGPHAHQYIFMHSTWQYWVRTEVEEARKDDVFGWESVAHMTTCCCPVCEVEREKSSPSPEAERGSEGTLSLTSVLLCPWSHGMIPDEPNISVNGMEWKR